MNNSYAITGFQSPCVEFTEKSLSLDEYYETQKPSRFIIEVAAGAPSLDIKKGDRLLIDRAITPREGQLSVFVINNEFTVRRFSKKLLENQDPETGDFIWGVIKLIMREPQR